MMFPNGWVKPRLCRTHPRALLGSTASLRQPVGLTDRRTSAIIAGRSPTPWTPASRCPSQ